VLLLLPAVATRRGRIPKLAHAARYLERMEVNSEVISRSGALDAAASADESFAVGKASTKVMTWSRASKALRASVQG
jgi:hypothetical protein